MKIGYNNTKEGNVMEIFKNSKINALFISLMMMAILLCCSRPVQAAQEGDYTYTVTDGKAEITGYTGAGGDIILPDTLGGYPLTSIGNDAFSVCKGLTAVSMPQTLTSIGDRAFWGCSSLSSISIPAGVTSIGKQAFVFCTGINSISIPERVTSIGENAFAACTGLTSIIVAANNSNYASDDGVLYNKAKTFLIMCPWGKTSVSIPNGVKSIGSNAFKNCELLTIINIPEGVTTIGEDAFAYCDSLININLPQTLTSIGDHAFCWCPNLYYINIPEGVTVISKGAFLGCEGLIGITLPQTVTTIGNQAFDFCESLTSISLPQSVTSIGMSAFDICTSLASISFNSATTTIYDDKYTISDKATIKGFDPSTAKDYAEKYSRRFEEITSAYPYLAGPVTFVSYYPTNDSVASEVQKGGKAFRYYRILDQDGVPVSNKAFSYRFTGQSNVYIGTTDVDGYVSIETPWLSVDSHLDLEMLAEDGAVKDDVTSSPSFDVKITERSFSQEWSILFGESISGGLGGPMAKLGPMKFETLKAGLSADFSSKVTLTDDIKGNTNQVTLASNIEGGLGADAAAGVFGSLWESKKKPELNVGFTSGLKAKLRNGVAYKFEDFLNTSRSDHYTQALAAGTFLLETSLQSLQQDPVGMDIIMNALINRLTNLDTYQDARVSEYALGGSMGGSAEVSVLNPLGNKASIGDKMGLSLADFGKDILFSHENREQADGVNKTELSVTSSVQASFLKFKLAEIFSKNKTSKESPKLEVENIIPALWENKAEGKQSISVESGAKNKLSVSQTVNIEEPFGLQSQTEERRLEVEVEGQALNELAASSSDANNIINEDKIFIGPNTLNNIFKNVLSLNNTQQWKREVKDVSTIRVPFNIGLGLGLQAELGLNLEGTEELKYTDKRGILSNKLSMLCLEEYQKDNIIAEQQKDLKDFAQVYADAIGTVIKDLVVTAKGSIVEGIQQEGAYIKAAWDNCTGFLSILKPRMNSYQILAVSPEELSVTQAATIGDVYIVNLQDAENNLIDDFTSNPIELSINFSQELLLATGFDPSEANKLSIYRWDGATGLYVLQASVVDEINNKVTAMISQPGQYILAIDVAAPNITNFITSNSTAAPVISAIVRDTFCGIDNSSFNFLLDGVSKVDANNLADYYDPLSGIFTYQVMTDLTSGGHTAAISVKDMAGNSSEANIAFQVNSSLPVINFTPVTEASAGTDLAITANITDDSGVANAILFFKPDNTEYAFQGVTMYNHSGTDRYTGVIPGTELNGYTAIRYYIKAIDRAGNKSADGAETILKLNTAGSQNDAPIAKNVAISGSAMSGQILNGSYTYSDTENDPQGLPIYKWYRDEQVSGTSKMEIAGANSYSYTLGTRDVGKYIFFEVIPIATSGNLTGTAVQSIAFGPVTAAVAQKPFTINTTFKVNQTNNVTSLTADALLDAKTIVTNNQTSGSQQVVVIVALYNHHGTLLNITYLAKEVAAGGTETFHAGFKLPADVEGSKVRVFVWDGEDYLSSPMHPLSDVTQIPEL